LPYGPNARYGGILAAIARRFLDNESDAEEVSPMFYGRHGVTPKHLIKRAARYRPGWPA
jgi:hypothetical protein